MGVPVQSVICASSGRPEQVLAQQLGLSRRVIVSWLREGLIRSESTRLRKGERVESGQRLYLSLDGQLGDWVQPVAEPYSLLAHHDDWLALTKPPGMPSHLRMPFEVDTILNHFVAHDLDCATAGEDPLQGSLVHRLDTDASGTIIAARNLASYHRLRERFASGDVRRLYRARVMSPTAQLPTGAGECRSALSARGARVVVDPSGRATHTLWRALDDHGLLEIEIKTGHRHQIRVHLASQGWPILGDTLYEGAPQSRLALHCVQLAWENHDVRSSIPSLLEPRESSDKNR